MLSHPSRSVLLGGWFVLLAIIVGASIAMDANLSTTALVLALSVAPAIVTLLIAGGAPSPSVAEILHAVDTKDRRS